MTLPAVLASHYARLALRNVVAEFPNKLDHVMDCAADACTPRVLHPIFYGSFDWHSAVHMHWLLAALLARFPDLPEGAAIRTLLDEHFTLVNVAGECAYLARPGARSFERTYGWAWLLKLAAELHAAARHDADAAHWRDALQPLTDAFVARYLTFLPQADYPIRAGTHANSAFGLLFALDYAEATAHVSLQACIVTKAREWFARDRRYPALYEPAHDDFLSGGLLEAMLMRRVGGAVADAFAFAPWWAAFAPDDAGIANWLAPVRVADRSDPKLAHLDGLNLSRAWCWSQLVDALPDAFQPRVHAAIDDHLAASLPHVADSDYVGTHWLASFALLALLAKNDLDTAQNIVGTPGD